MARKEKNKSKYNRFARFFCKKEGDNYICDEINEDLYVSEDKRVLFGKNIEALDEYFSCQYDTEKNRIYACIWNNHSHLKTEEKTIKKMIDTEEVPYTHIHVKGKQKPVPVIKKGCSLVGMKEYERALRTFMGDKVKIMYDKGNKKMQVGCFSPVVVSDENTGEVIFISPYATYTME